MNSLEYNLSKMAPKNKSELMSQLEFHFNAYLKGLKCSQEEKDFLKSLIKSKGGIVGLLKDVYKDRFVFYSTQEFSLEDLRKFLEDVSEIGKTLYENIPEEQKKLLEIESNLPASIGGKHYFENLYVRYQDMMRIETFFRIFLVNKFIPLSQESEQKLDTQYHAHIIANMIRGELFTFAAKIEHIQKENIGKLLTQYLHILLTYANTLSYEKTHTFLEAMKMIDMNDYGNQNAHKICYLLRQALGEIVIQEEVKTNIRSILLGDYNKKGAESFEFRLIPEDNFYFRKEEEVFGINDVFPEDGTMYYKQHILQNVCIFHPNGKKVYRGDIKKSDYEKISGTYYVLDDLKGWRNVPKYAKGNITSLQEIKDPHLQKVREQNKTLARQFIPKNIPYLSPEYIRTFALGKIEKGAYIENNNRISY